MTRATIRFVSLSLATLLLHACVSNDNANLTSEFRDCYVCPEMVEIPIGEFLMGSEGGEEGRSEGLIHEVSIKRQFALASTETIVAEFREFVGATAYQAERECRTLIRGSWANSSDYYIALHPATTDPQQPVSNPTVACERHSVRGSDWLTRPDR